MNNGKASRREFLKRAGALSLSGVAAPFALNLAALGEAAAANATGYKALVCVFLYGGNDYANTLVTYDKPTYDMYAVERPAIAYARNLLTPSVLVPHHALPDGRQYALAPGLQPLLGRFQDGKLAALLNVGTLIEPTTKDQYSRGVARLPKKLFSHNDQQATFQSDGPEGNVTGWGGRMGDLYAAGNGNSIFTCIGMSGNAVFLSGSNAIAYQMAPAAPNGTVPINGITSLFGSPACSTALKEMITAKSTNLFEASYTAIVRRALTAEAQLGVLSNHQNHVVFPGNNDLAAQLSMVARVIAARNELQTKRQVFFVSMGGFDTHDGVLTDHPVLLAKVADAMAAFQTELAALRVEDQVTTFTGSDFGRTLNSDGDGSDHGWGSMHFVMGGAVKGCELYGKAPVMANDGPDDTGRGRLLPTMSVDQYGATLGKWFGVSNTELLDVFPNLRNFDVSQRDLGFMKPG